MVGRCSVDCFVVDRCSVACFVVGRCSAMRDNSSAVWQVQAVLGRLESFMKEHNCDALMLAGTLVDLFVLLTTMWLCCCVLRWCCVLYRNEQLLNTMFELLYKVLT